MTLDQRSVGNEGLPARSVGNEGLAARCVNTRSEWDALQATVSAKLA